MTRYPTRADYEIGLERYKFRLPLPRPGQGLVTLTGEYAGSVTLIVAGTPDYSPSVGGWETAERFGNAAISWWKLIMMLIFPLRKNLPTLIVFLILLKDSARISGIGELKQKTKTKNGADGAKYISSQYLPKLRPLPHLYLIKLFNLQLQSLP
jgi:ABC-type arginine transport system permease subunit